ncbi:MAG: hypothetical protein B0D96_00440 [Candidatus Sedimenticola endophacoides]|uniref:DUF1249 domain-containing protein n=1 Tax=Candidatus Sedimenticola endophacoides TaxID=2548426 RepID=A0A657Q0G9_9GAMM|nr:MAG: hypothetical protein B0D94_04320 [Candidatus Sedimenticola endophacoides]OQX33947.1 MAG: hypothetical protein B0D84_04020 [Candidatus Sedimenticola endophacoides]OQX38289.1 MAG: hypothetical protein B0D96_00440 [Candidatus Sedimenticola endophacoides]OQX41012.1 MAG: hypothetical protein B0D89_05810 [Candidatus Sedimenticola endophacoides]OQX43869.1 MAG: hypothetical protein B0D83_00680 [Candidatus Sedimenticola endophacoides]
MRMPWYPWSLRSLANSRPSVGWLMDLCDENHVLMCRLAPGLRDFTGSHRSRLGDGMDLHLEVLEQTPYTTLVHLTYYFTREGARSRPDPDARLRVYHDCAQVEVLALRQHALPLEPLFEHPALDQKWKANLFLSKWLAYCLQQGHRFTSAPRQSLPDLSETG